MNPKPKLMRADEVKVGDVICFAWDSFNYTVEEVAGPTQAGFIRLTHGNGTASDSYLPGSVLRVVRQ